MNTNLNKSKIKNPAKKNILPFKLPNYINLKTFFDKEITCSFHSN